MRQERRSGGERREEHTEMVRGERGRGREGGEEEKERERGMRESTRAKENGRDERRGGGEGRGERTEVRREVMVWSPVVREYAAYGVCQVLVRREEAREAEKSMVDFWFGEKGFDSHFRLCFPLRGFSLELTSPDVTEILSLDPHRSI